MRYDENELSFSQNVLNIKDSRGNQSSQNYFRFIKFNEYS